MVAEISWSAWRPISTSCPWPIIANCFLPVAGLVEQAAAAKASARRAVEVLWRRVRMRCMRKNLLCLPSLDGRLPRAIARGVPWAKLSGAPPV